MDAFMKMMCFSSVLAVCWNLTKVRSRVCLGECTCNTGDYTEPFTGVQLKKKDKYGKLTKLIAAEIIYEGQSKSKGNIHFMASIDVTVRN